jgi:hypothetical protein
VDASLGYPIVDTAQGTCYDDRVQIPCSQADLAGQDGQYGGNAPRYQDNGDGTVDDLVTGLTWQQEPGEKMTYAQAVAGAASFSLAGHSDWRLPTIKELYSLILFDGTDISACSGRDCAATPFIDTRYFDFRYGDTSSGERVIDSQFASSTRYTSTTMNGDETVFGVNFADGRIKGYGLSVHGSDKTFFVLYVRGNPNYGQSRLMANADGTIADQATGLTWMQADSGEGMDWPSALAYCEGSTAANYNDWRLPNAKELHSIVDYSRSPATADSAASDPLFSVSTIADEGGRLNYPFYWTSTTHATSDGGGRWAVYIAFGEALGYMSQPTGGSTQLMDVHGAGAQRSDPKSGDASQYQEGHGPQGDVVRIHNHVRCVRGGNVGFAPDGNLNPARPVLTVNSTGLPGKSGGPQGGTPPQEALHACSTGTAGAACQFATPNGTLVIGACQLIEQQLACVPANSP